MIVLVAAKVQREINSCLFSKYTYRFVFGECILLWWLIVFYARELSSLICWYCCTMTTSICISSVCDALVGVHFVGYMGDFSRL